jgi:hypothetical protein
VLLALALGAVLATLASKGRAFVLAAFAALAHAGGC